MSDTAGLNLINLQVSAEDQIALDKAAGTYAANLASDSKYYLWQGDFQTIPLGMDGNPEQFAAKIREALPGVNALRLPFNELSFNADGTLHPLYERFLTAAAAEGFELLFTYAGGDVQRFDDGGSGNADAIYDALAGGIFDGMQAGWTAMTDWLGAHADVAQAVYGFELANEPAAYSKGDKIDAAVNGDRFLELYATQMAELADQVSAFDPDARVLVGGWGYSGQFDPLTGGDIGGQSALEYLRASVGEALVWSAHYYPGWGDSGSATTVAEMEAILQAQFDILGGDDILVTETNAPGSVVDNVAEIDSPTFLMARAAEWYSENGIGIGWFPGVETGASNFVVIDANGSLRYLHANSLAHGLNQFSLNEAPPEHAGDDLIETSIVAGRLRNEGYQENPLGFDDIDGLGFGYGYGGNDTITGHDRIADFAYGGSGDDVISGLGGDDHLFGQYGHDSLSGGDGHDHLFGGDGDDTLSGGTGNDQLNGGEGADLFIHGGGRDDIIDYDHAAGDRLDLGAGVLRFADLLAMGTLVDASGNGHAVDLVIETGTGPLGEDARVTLYNFATLNAALIAAPPVEPVPGLPPGIDPAAFDSLLIGGAGDDGLGGGRGADLILGGAGNDTLGGQGGADMLWGGDGNDDLHSGKHGAVLNGGAGDDRLALIASKGGVHLATGGEGQDLFRILGVSGERIAQSTITDFSAEQDRIEIDGQPLDAYLAMHLGPGGASLVQDGPDLVVQLTPNQALILQGWQGPDLLQAFGLSTELMTPAPRDADAPGALWGLEDGLERRDPTNAADLLSGTDGNDVVHAGAGNDIVHGGRGDDLLMGGSGDDLLNGAQGHDTLIGGAGNDTLTGDRGHNLLQGGAGDDVIWSGRHGSVLEGGDGEDVLHLDLSYGAAHLASGGAGADVFLFEGLSAERAGSVTVTDFEAGIDRLMVDGVDGVLWMTTLLARGELAVHREADRVTLECLSDGDRLIFDTPEGDLFDFLY